MTSIETIHIDTFVPGADPGSAVFTALADPTRRAMVQRLARDGAMTVGALSEPFTVSAPAISRHLKVLEGAGLVSRSVDRQWRICSLRLEPLLDARHWLDEVCGEPVPG